MTKYTSVRSIIVLLSIIFLVSCGPKTTQVTIISTNDVHASIGQFPRLATLVEEYRKSDPNNVILVDAGDRWTGNPFVDRAAERGKPIIDLYNALGYNIATIGNHEFDFGLEVLSKRLSEANFTTVVANTQSNGSALPNFKPYTFVNIDGQRFCFFGLVTVTESGYPEGSPDTFGTATFIDPYKRAQELRNLKDSCNILVALTHIGYPEDTMLAHKFPEINLIIGGHSHDTLHNGKLIGSTLVTQTGKSLKFAGITTLTFEGKNLVNIENRLVKLDTIMPSPKYEKIVEEYNKSPEMLVKVGEAEDEFDREALVNFMSDALRLGTKADIAFYHNGGVRINSLPEGDINVADIYRIEPFGTKASLLRMNEQQLRNMIIRKYNSTGKESHRIDLYPSGTEYEIVLNEQGNAQDVRFRFDRPKSVYLVALPDYVTATYDFPEARSAEIQNILITNLMTDYLKVNNPAEPDDDERAEEKSKN